MQRLPACVTAIQSLGVRYLNLLTSSMAVRITSSEAPNSCASPKRAHPSMRPVCLVLADASITASNQDLMLVGRYSARSSGASTSSENSSKSEADGLVVSMRAFLLLSVEAVMINLLVFWAAR